jgi:hypothetical protein
MGAIDVHNGATFLSDNNARYSHHSLDPFKTVGFFDAVPCHRNKERRNGFFTKLSPHTLAKFYTDNFFKSLYVLLG